MDFEAWRDDVVCQEEVRMISVEDWAEIRRLHFAEELGIKTIAKRLGIARNTVRAAVRSSEPPSYQREGPGSRVDAVEDELRALLGEYPEMPAGGGAGRSALFREPGPPDVAQAPVVLSQRGLWDGVVARA